ncbi:MAG: phage tail assembly chaperone [Rhodospirillales bacterium]
MAKKTVVIYSTETVEPVEGPSIKGTEQITITAAEGGIRGRIYKGQIIRVKSGPESAVDYDIANHLQSNEDFIEVSTDSQDSDITQNTGDYYVDFVTTFDELGVRYDVPRLVQKPTNNIGKYAVFNASSGEWAVDTPVANTALRGEVKAVCDELLAATDYTQLSDVVTSGFLTSAQVTEYANYREALRDLRGGTGITATMVSIDQVTFPTPPEGSDIETPTPTVDDPTTDPFDPDFNFDF